MTAVSWREKVLQYAEGAEDGFTSADLRELLGHPNAANLTTLLRNMCEQGQLVRDIEARGSCIFVYRKRCA